MKPRGKINTPAKAQAAREYLGLSKAGLARVLRLGTGNGRETVRRIEAGGNDSVPGPYQLALEALVSGWRPWGVKIEAPEGSYGDKDFHALSPIIDRLSPAQLLEIASPRQMLKAMKLAGYKLVKE